MLERNRIPLLRHDAAALHVPVRQPEVAELARTPEQQILDDASEAAKQYGGRAHALEQIVDGRNAAVRISRRPVETEELGGQASIDREARAGDRAGPERILIGGRIGRSEEHTSELQ